MSLDADVRALVARTALTLCGLTLLVVFASLGFRDAGRQWLGFTFPGVPATLEQAGSIFLANARIACAPLAAAIAVNAPWISAHAEESSPRLGTGWLAARLLCDAALLLTALTNVAVVGVGIGTYGARMLRAILPHGPLELVAFSMALSIYLLARRGPLSWAAALALAGGTFMLLALGALVEVYVAL